MKYLVGLLAVVALVAGATYAGYEYFQDEIDTRAGGGVNGGDNGVVAATTTAPTSIPNENQVIVLGTVDSIHVEGAILSSLAMPLTITTPDRGSGAGARIQGVQVDGSVTDIEWDAGTPLVMDGDGGSLVTGPVTIDADPQSTTVGLGTSPSGFADGTYSLRSSVAVGTGGLARAVDSVTFAAAGASSIVFRGDAGTTFPTRTLEGRGTGKLTLSGHLTIVRPDRSQTAIGSASLDDGQFDLQLTADGTRLTVKVTLQGAVNAA